MLANYFSHILNMWCLCVTVETMWIRLTELVKNKFVLLTVHQSQDLNVSVGLYVDYCAKWIKVNTPCGCWRDNIETIKSPPESQLLSMVIEVNSKPHTHTHNMHTYSVFLFTCWTVHSKCRQIYVQNNVIPYPPQHTHSHTSQQTAC